MIRSTKLNKTQISSGKSSNSLHSAICCAFISLWFFNDTLLGPNLVTILSASRWVLLAPALMLLLQGFTRMDRAAMGQLFFLTATLVSVFTSQDIYISTISWVRMFCPFCIALGVATLTNENKYNLSRWILATLIIFSFASFLSSFSHIDGFYQGATSESDDTRTRLAGFTFHPNTLGILLAVLICFGVMKILFLNKDFKNRLKWLLVIIISLYDLYKTDSRTGYLAVSLGLFILFSKKYIIDFAKDNVKSFVVSLGIVAITIVMVTVPLMTALDMIKVGNDLGKYELSTLSRLNLWNIGWEDFLRYPLTGIGLGATISNRVTSGFSEELPYFHSVLIHYMATAGIIGAIGVLVMIIGTELRVLTFLNPAAPHEFQHQNNNELIQFCVTCMLVMIIFSITEGTLQGEYPSFLLFFLSTALLPRADLAAPKVRRTQSLTNARATALRRTRGPAQ